MDFDALYTETSGFEGFRANPYKDSLGLWTVGEGRCLETSPLTGAEWKALLDSGFLAISITQTGSKYLTVQRLMSLDAALVHAWLPYTAMPDGVRSVLVEMSFQLGLGTLLSFTTFLGLLANRQYAAAATDGRTTKWYSQTTSRAEILMKQLEAI